MSSRIKEQEQRLMEILEQLPEKAVENVLSYAEFVRKQIYDEEDKLDQLAEKKFIELCKKKGIPFQRLDDEEAIRIACELIHRRRESETTTGSS